VDQRASQVGILQQIHHPNVMRLFEFYEDKTSYALVTEMVGFPFFCGLSCEIVTPYFLFSDFFA
jgi:hypothetical protein